MITSKFDLRNKIDFYKKLKAIESSSLFDLDYYNFVNEKNFTRREAVKHYLKCGKKEPNRFFSNEYYLSSNNDVREANIEPFLHFIQYGATEKRSCNKLFDMNYISNYMRRTGREKGNYLEVILSDLNVLDDLDESSFYLNYDQKIIQEEIDEINSQGLFDINYYLEYYPDVKEAGIDPLSHYLFYGFKENRNPSGKFDTYFYKSKHQRNHKLCPLIHYVRLGKDNGLSILPKHAISANTFKNSAPLSKKIAVQIHLYYSDVINELLPYLNDAKHIADLFISTTTHEDKLFIERKLEKADLLDGSDVRVVKNIGRDIAPLFVEFSDIWCGYDYVCHLHSKKSPHTSFGHRWRTYLFDQLIGDDNKLVGMINYLDNNKDVGVVFPDHYFEIKEYVGDNGNINVIKKLLNDINLEYQPKLVSGDFPAGSMCIMRTKAFLPLTQYKLTLDEYQNEDGQVEGTLAHATERCLTMIPELLGYRIARYYGMLSNPEQILTKWNRKDTFRNASTNEVLQVSKWLRDTPDIALNERVLLAPPYPYYNPNSLCIHWIIPDFGIGAGGHMTIFRMVKYLEEFGHRQLIWIQNAHNYPNPFEAKKCIQKHYQNIGDNVIVQFLPEDVSHISGDVIIATDCWTTFPMMQMSRFKERFYLIQDWEPMFHPVGDSYLIADLTYDFDLNALCAGKWLFSKAKEKGLWARSWDLASDSRYYYPNEKVRKNKFQLTIAFYARAYTSRRAVMLGVAALKALHKRGVDIHVQFFGQDNLDFGVEFSHEYLGILSPKELGHVYRNADIGLVFSATNYSLIPLEMMACQLPVIELDVDSTRAVFDEAIVEMVKPDPLALADRIEYLINHPDILSEKAKKAVKYAQGLSWRNSARIIEEGIKDKLSERYTAIDPGKLLSNGELYKVKVSVIVPTFNAGDEFESVLNSLITQNTNFSYEIVIVDSGSTDNTLSIIRNCDSDLVRLFEIPNEEFQHGRTRNFAISKSQGEYVAVMTQDAKPYNELWLSELISMFTNQPDIVGVFGAHKAYEHHSPFIKRDIDRVFDNYECIGDKYYWSMRLPESIQQGSISWQFILQYYSDNNSCMRKSVWDQLPYPEINWGEDQAWAWMIIQLGLTKGYAKDAIVLHSHDDDYDKKFKVSKIEGEFFKERFGLKLYSEDTDIEKVINLEQANDEIFAERNGISSHQLEVQLELIRAAHSGRFIGSSNKGGV